MDKKLIKRDIFERVSQHLNKAEITLITGPRQAGKTTLLRQLKAWLIGERKVPSSKIFYFDLDLIKDWEFFQDQTEFIEYCRAEAGKSKIYVFVDEAQKVDDCARFFKGVYDSNLNLKLILSGSSSFELKSKLKESLAGRKRIFSLLPFSFKEYVSGRANELAHYIAGQKKIPILVRGKLLKHYFDYLVWGGYPRVALEPKREERIALLAEIYSSYIEKDIIGLLEIKNKQGFTRLLSLVLAQTGQLVNIAELANMANLDRDTIERYLYALEQTF